MKRILFPTDCSPLCEAYTAQVAEVANHFEANVTLLFADQKPGSSRQADAANRFTERVGAFLDPSRLQRIFTTEPAAVKVVELDRSERFDLVMIPSHGRGTLGRIWRRSVVEYAVRHCYSAIWTAHGDSAISMKNFKRIACMIGLTAATRSVVSFSAELAERWKAELSFLHAVPEWDERLLTLAASRELPATLSPETARLWLSELTSSMNVASRVHVETGETVDVFRRLARKHPIDLLVVSGSALSRERDSTSDRVVGLMRSSPCPVLVLGQNSLPQPAGTVEDRERGEVISLPMSMSRSSRLPGERSDGRDQVLSMNQVRAMQANRRRKPGL